MNRINRIQATRAFFPHWIRILTNRVSQDVGQSTIEFIFSFSFVILILMLCVRVSISMVNGFLVQFAVFQASRAYLVEDTNSNTESTWDSAARDAANRVFKSYMNGKVSPIELKFNDAGAGGDIKPAFIGPYYEYKQEQFTTSDLMGGGGPDKKLNLISESFLGKEPTKFDCLESTFARIKDILGSAPIKELITTTDDGC